ncbi:MFS transporter [Ornithinicoccus halotolerans]|uniref:MFS transporter n=1 Tax=Ornithinicoccus halotolerans TaxID=1748220 RepID=UPI00129557A7|nr:MFS transporter [Ornithinicoccus halotolerans]
MPASAPSRRRTLFRHHDFRQVWMGDTVSVFGMELVGLAIPVMAVQLLDADEFEMGLLVSLQMLAFLLIGLPSGAWVDRWRKKRVLVLGDLSRGLVLLSLPAAWVLGVLTLEQLFVVAFVTGGITVFFDVANQSYLPEIVDADQIGEGNAKLQASQQTAAVVGPALGAALLRLIGAPLTIAVTSVCMALSSLFVSRVRHVEERPDPADRRPLRTEIAEGLAFVVRHPLLVRITACTGLSNFVSSAVQALFVLYILRDLGLNEATLGLVFSAGGVGGILGALTADRTARLVGEGRVIPLSAVLMVVASTGVPLASVLPSVPTLLVGWFLVSWAVVVYNITQVSFRQRLCPRPLLGRMNASIRFLVWGPMPVGAFIGGVLGEQLGVLPTMWLSVGGALVAALPVVLSPLVGMRELPRRLDALQADSREE